MKLQSYVFFITCISSDVLRSLSASNNCSSFPCENEALCEDTTAGYQCYCVDGYAGSNCEINFDDCSSAPCLNSATCVDDVAAYRCLCQSGFTGENCQVNIDECQSNPCLREGRCIDLINGFICECLVPYKGDNCSLLPCDTAPCENGAICYDDVTFNYTTQGYFCDCVLGFTGLRCEINSDDCNSTACSGQGICVDGVGDYSCLCEPGFVGDDCQFSVNDCAGNECRNNATCHDLHMRYWCECLVPGYEGLLCERERDECTSWEPCQNGATCVDKFNGYSCHCTENWNGVNCTEEVNKCLKNPCLNNAGCIDLSDGFFCQCQPFYTGRLCETAFNPCAAEYSPCQNEAECIAPPDGQYRCFCQTGFTGQQCEVNVNECLSFPCHNNATCEDVVGGYVCHCMAGWTGENCRVNIDDCVGNPCQNEGACVDLVNSFECNCTEYYTGSLCEDLYDYCNNNPCYHDSTCSLVVGGYQCYCLPPYTGEQCLDVIDACENEPCHNNGSCVNMSPGFYCNCDKPYTGLTCEDTSSYCASEPCLNGGLCRDGIEEFFCICPPLLTGKQCTDLIDYCESRPCKNDGICLNAHFTYRCICAYGFEGVNCTDMVNFCDENPCQNLGKCSNIPGGYECECTDQFYGKFCENILPSTTHGVSSPLSNSTYLISISPTTASHIIEVSSMKPTDSSKLLSLGLSSEVVPSSYISVESTYTATALLSRDTLKFTVASTLLTRRTVAEGFSTFLSDVPKTSSSNFASTSPKMYGSSISEMSGQASSSLSEKEEHTTSLILPESYTELTSSVYAFTTAASSLTESESKYETVITESIIIPSLSSTETFLTLPSIKSASLEALLYTNTVLLIIPSILSPSLSKLDYLSVSRTSSDIYSDTESSDSRELHPITSMSISSLYKKEETINSQTVLTEYAVRSIETVFSLDASQFSLSSYILKSVEYSGISLVPTLSESSSATAPLYVSASLVPETVDRTKGLRISAVSSLTLPEFTASFVKTDSLSPLKSELSSSVLRPGVISSLKGSEKEFFSATTPSSSLKGSEKEMFSAITHMLPSFTKLSSSIMSTVAVQFTSKTKSPALTLLSSITVSSADTEVALTTKFTAFSQLTSTSASPELTQLLSETVSVDHTQHMSRVISPTNTQLTSKSTASVLTHPTSTTSTEDTQLSPSKTALPTVTSLAPKTMFSELTHHTSGAVSPTLTHVYSSHPLSVVVTKSTETFSISPNSSSQYSSFTDCSSLKEENATLVASSMDFSKQSSEPLQSSSHSSIYQGSILSPILKSEIYTEVVSHSMSSYRHSLKSVQPSDQLRTSNQLIASTFHISHVSSVTEQIEPTPSFLRSSFDRVTISPSASVHHQSNFQPTELLSGGSTEVLSSAPKSVIISIHSSISPSLVVIAASSTIISPLSSVNEFESASSISGAFSFISASYQTPDEIKSSISPTYIGTVENLQSTSVIETSHTKVVLSSTSSERLPSVLTGISSGSISTIIQTADSIVIQYSKIHTSLVQSSTSLLLASNFNPESIFLVTLSSDTVLEKTSSSAPFLPSKLSVDASISMSGVESEGFSVIATTSVLLRSIVKQPSSVQVLSSEPMISSKADSVFVVSGLIGSSVSKPVADTISIATGFMLSSSSTPRLSIDVYTTSIASRTVTSSVAMTTDSPDTACEAVHCYNGGVCKINGSAVCDCPSRYTGPHCETAITMPVSLFNGTTILEIESPDVNDSVIIQLSFKTLQDTGILLHYHLKPEPIASVVSLQIVEGVLQLYFTCGSQSFILNTRVRVNNARLFTVTLRQTMTCQASIDLVDNSIEKQPLAWIIGTNQLTEMGRMTRISSLLIGGLSEDLSNENDRNFTGCLGYIWLNGNPIWANDSLHRVELVDCSSLMSEELCEDVDCLNGGQCHVTVTTSGTISPTCDCMVPYTGVRCETEILLYYPSFDGTSYLKYAAPSFYANQSNEIYMSVRPMALDGTLLVSASQNGGNKQKSFIYLYVEDEFIWYKFSCDGQTVGSISSKARIKMGETVEVVIRQSWTSGPGQWCNAAIIVNSVVSVSQPFLSLGQSQPLGNLFLGGTPRNSSLLQDLHDSEVTGLIGCVKDLQMNGLELDLIAMATEGMNIGNCGIPVCEHNPCENGATCHSSGEDWYCDCVPGYSGRLCSNKLCVSNMCLHGGTCVVMETENDQLCLCPLGRGGILCEEALAVSMPHFSGTLYGHTSFMAYQNMVGMKYDFEITFSLILDNDTTTSSGSMFLMGSTASRPNGDFMALGVYKDYLVFQYNLGSGAASVWSSGPLDITLPHHTIQFGRHDREGWLKVDDQQTISGKSPGLLTVLNTDNILYVGGTEVPSGTTFENGLKGCIYNLKIRSGGGGFFAPGSPPGSADYGRSVSQCSSLSCDHSPCQNEAHCVEVGPSVYCNCTEDWKGLFCTEKVTVCDMQHACADGATCLPRVTGGYECLCPLGRKGENCTEAITISDPKFVGEKSFMSFTPVYIKQKMNIRLQIKPAVLNGILFYVAERLHSYSGDFLSLALHDGKMEMRYHHGDQLIVMVSDLVMKVDSEEWYTVEAGRNTTHGYLSVNNQYIVAMTTGRMTHLDTATDFYLGGVPDLEKINTLAVPNEPSAYEGCVREFIVNGINYQLSEEGAADGRNIDDCDGTLCGYSVCVNGGTCTITTSLPGFSCMCSEHYYGDICEEPIECRDLNCLNGGSCHRHVTGSYGCSCSVGWTGPSCDIAVNLGSAVQLTRDSYMYYIDTDYETSNKTYTKLSVSFKTTELNGLLIWNGQSYSDEEDYLGLGLRDGRLRLVWNLGWYSRSEVITSNKYNDGQWHTVLIERHGQNLIMTVEGVERESKAPGDFYNLDTHGHYFIGGFRDGSVHSKSLEFYTDSFQGCLRDLYIHDEGPVSFLQAADGWNIINC